MSDTADMDAVDYKSTLRLPETGNGAQAQVRDGSEAG